MSAVETVPCDGAVTMTVTADLIHRCPFVDEVDRGTVEIRWTTAGRTVELHSLTAYLRTWADVQVSHEAVTDRIAAELDRGGIRDVHVTTRWVTAGSAVEVVGRAVSRERLLAGGA